MSNSSPNPLHKIYQSSSRGSNLTFGAAPDGGDDAVWVCGPDERFGIGVLFGYEAVDGGLEVDERMECAALEAAVGELGEEALDGVEPRA